MNSEKKTDTGNIINGVEQKEDMDIVTKFIRTFFRVFTFDSLVFFLILLIGAFALLSRILPNNENNPLFSIILSFAIVYGIKFFQYYGD